MSVPSIMMLPRSGLTIPISALRNTDLPVPDGPSMTETSPAGMLRVTSPQISCLPKDLVRSSTLISTPTSALPCVVRPASRAGPRAHYALGCSLAYQRVNKQEVTAQSVQRNTVCHSPFEQTAPAP